MYNSLNLNTHNLQSLDFDNLRQMYPNIYAFGDCEGRIIADEFNHLCDFGLEIEYVEDGEWRFLSVAHAREAMLEIDRVDYKRQFDFRD